MRRLLCATLLFTACATSTPLGARATLEEGYRPFSPTSAARELPREAPAGGPTALQVPPGARDAVVQAARRLVGQHHVQVKGKRFSDDCSGLVRAVYGTIGVDPLQEAQAGDNGVTALWRFASAHGRHYEGGRPVEGDLVFFRDTADTNRDGADDDGLTHVGLVDGVEADGTVTVIHRVASGVVRYRMNLGTPRQATAADGHTLNDWLRPPGPGHHPRLTAELFAGYATLLPIEPRLAGR